MTNEQALIAADSPQALAIEQAKAGVYFAMAEERRATRAQPAFDFQAEALEGARKAQRAARHWHAKAVQRLASGDTQGARLAQREAAAWHHDAALELAFGAGLDSYESMLNAAGV